MLYLRTKVLAMDCMAGGWGLLLSVMARQCRRARRELICMRASSFHN